jgi:hypothetical protein
MNPTTYEFLAADHLRDMRRQAAAARRSAQVRQAPTTPRDRRTGISGLSFEIVRRLVSRLVAA